jgi:hypothetical protein
VSLCVCAAYVFALSGGDGSAWTLAQKLVAADNAAGDLFGWAISLHGGMLAVGARYDGDKGVSSGGLYV